MSNSLRVKKWWLLIGLLVLFFLFFIAGTMVGSGNLPFFSFSLSKKSQFSFRPVAVDTKISKTRTITPDGGSIRLVDAYGTKISLTVPKNAVAQNTDITLSALTEIPLNNYETSDQSPNVLISPQTLHFDVPAQLTFDFDPTDDEQDVPVANTLDDNASENDDQNAEESPPIQDPLTPEEEARRANGLAQLIGEFSQIIFTDSDTDHIGTRIRMIPIDATDSTSAQTPVFEGGSYSYDEEPTEDESLAYGQEVLNNPNATSDEIMYAGFAIRRYGFDRVSTRVRNQLKERLWAVKNRLERVCRENSAPVSRNTIAGIISLAQDLAMDALKTESFKLFDSCSKHYTFSCSHTAYGRTDTYTASVCGFIDDQWKMDISLLYVNDCGGGTGSVDPFQFRIYARGGSQSTPYVWKGRTFVCGHDSSLTEMPTSLNTLYDGNRTIQLFAPESYYLCTAQIEQTDSCSAE